MKNNDVITTDHDEIRAWVEEHNGRPTIRDKRGDQRGVLDIVFNELDGKHQIISWEEFFDTFDTLNMQFRYECTTDECDEFSFSLISQNEAEAEIENEDKNEIVMPEDDIPIENVVPSAPSFPSLDATNNTMTYT